MPVNRGLLAGSSWLFGRRQQDLAAGARAQASGRPSRRLPNAARPRGGHCRYRRQLCCSRLAPGRGPPAVPTSAPPCWRPAPPAPCIHVRTAFMPLPRLFLHAASTPLDAFLNPKHENNLFLVENLLPLENLKKKKKKDHKENASQRFFFFFES